MNKENIFAFIDSQNLNLGVSSDIYLNDSKIYTGWKLDYRKFRKFLKDKYRVTKAYLFIGQVAGNERLYEFLQDAGYILIFKPTLEYKSSNKKITKGNVDAELVLYAAARQFSNYDKAVVVSGDGDFHCLYEYLVETDKLLKILIPNKYKFSSLLRVYSTYFDFVSTQKTKLSKQKSEYNLVGRTQQGNSLS